MPKKTKPSGTKRPPKKKRAATPKSRGIAGNRLETARPPASVKRLVDSIATDGGAALGMYRDPLGGHWQILAGLPIDRVEPTPFQRDVSEAHVARLAEAIDKLDRFLDPLIAVRVDDGMYWVPNGAHRLAAMRQLGAKSIVALVVPEPELAYRILALNTEKAHNLRERALEVIRMAQGLVELDDRPERDYATEFEEPALLTLGLCYQERGRFAGSTYHSVIKRVERFLTARLSQTLTIRRDRAAKLVALDDAVAAAVQGLKARGFTSPYLKAFVVARINPLRFKRGGKAEFDETVDKMVRAAERFDPEKIRADQVAGASGPGDE